MNDADKEREFIAKEYDISAEEVEEFLKWRKEKYRRASWDKKFQNEREQSETDRDEASDE